MYTNLRLILLAGFLLNGSICIGQDLNKLPKRVSQLWALRQQGKKDEALRYIDPDTRQRYLSSAENPIAKIDISGLEFTNDPKRMYVVFKARLSLPQMGEL